MVNDMLCSMTGFGRSEVSVEERKVTVEIKSVNHRFLEAGIKLPKKLNYLDGDIRRILKSKIERGKVDVFITYENTGEGNVCLKYNSELAAEYYNIFKKMSDELGIDNDITTSKLGRCPEVIMMEEQSEDEDELLHIVEDAMIQACDKLVQARNAEGERLKADLMNKLDNIEKNVLFIQEKSPLIVAEYREKINERLHELLEDNQIDEGRIAQEVTIYADKICVDEEIIRLLSHIKAMRDSLNSNKAIGRKLDFITQEMNREANTTLSKTSNHEIADVAIELKTEIEKIREQIQNLE